MKTLSLGFILLVVVQPALPAQTFYGIAGGLNYAGPAPSDEHYTRGFALQASVGRQFGDRFGVRLDAFVNHFAVQESSIKIYMCPAGVLCPRSQNTAFTDRVGVTALRASALFKVDPPSADLRMYLIAGAGGYYFYQYPSIEGAVRSGLSAGAGFNIKVKGRSQVFIEGVYEKILGAPSQPTWLLPLTVGVRF
jgi:hypothetical protein